MIWDLRRPSDAPVLTQRPEAHRHRVGDQMGGPGPRQAAWPLAAQALVDLNWTEAIDSDADAEKDLKECVRVTCGYDLGLHADTKAQWDWPTAAPQPSARFKTTRVAALLQDGQVQVQH
eukprot:Skav202225  [mRNA]  locus=scaffold244:31065:32214:- [translate_table: standard]